MSLSTSTWSCPCAVPCEHACIVAAWLMMCDLCEAHTHVDSEGQLTSASSDELLRCIPTGTVCARQDRHPQPRDDSIFHQRHGRHTATNLYRHLRYWSHASFKSNVHLGVELQLRPGGFLSLAISQDRRSLGSSLAASRLRPATVRPCPCRITRTAKAGISTARPDQILKG